jgi:hypothetical protein
VSAYDNDPRVRFMDVGGMPVFYVDLPSGGQGRVMQVSGGRFEAASKPDRLDNPTFSTADEAIHSLIGDPQ